LNFFARFFVDSIPNLDPMSQKVFHPMQDEHGDAMEENEWVHEGSRACCKVNACSNSYAAKWLLCKHLDQTNGLQMQLGKFGHPSTSPKGLK
jgi:hypothetical protein